eukprot:TRINITY_DN2417_c1_g1_i1.p1 TRINITY_DN2417_c1_g1~~TRINITY_DN2417_c1_g1_i1.p1  ORF type:complete len:819 (+),score=273.51 TRINITY_DN2417_c1_g1_i1:214-2670(+)
MAQTVQLTDVQQAVKGKCQDFFRADKDGSKKYDRMIDEMVSSKRLRLIIDMQDLHGIGGGEDGPDFGHQVLLSPQDYLRFFDEALREAVEKKDFLKLDVDVKHLHVGFDGYFGRFHVSPRQLGAWHLNKLVALEGVVTHTTANIAKIQRSTHWNETKNVFIERQYRDQLAPDLDDNTLPTVNVMPKRDIDGNLLRTEHGLCLYTDMQNLTVQERPEKAPVGSLPRSVAVRLEGDLVDKCKPGDRARIIGIFLPFTENNKEFRTVLVANNVELLQDKAHAEGFDMLPEEERAIKKMAENKDVFKELSHAIAPSIFGHDQIKKAILLMMLGGVERNVGNHHIRGDIHLLLVGEPATAKSQLLRFIMKLAPFSLSTTGKGSSGVGLTGAVVTDPDTGEKSLAAGAMVLADRGVLCIDEFDKMGDGDRVAMHEAMEQGSVTIAKAGIQATLNGRCSVVAAANPVYGFYAVSHSVAFNIGLPESLLSRFDLLFIVLDDKSSQWTRMVADHVLQNHRTGKGITIGSEGEAENLLAAQTGPSGIRKATPVYVPNNPYKTAKQKKLVTLEFLRMYIQYAKKVEPAMTDEAREKIEDHWLSLRKEQANQELEGSSAIYINPRTLECLIRLSTAHAKCRLSDKVMPEPDVDVAIELLRHTVNARTEAVESRKREKREMEAAVAEDAATDAASDAQSTTQSTAASRGNPDTTGIQPLQKRPRTEPGASDSADADTQPTAADMEDLTAERAMEVARRALNKVLKMYSSGASFTTSKVLGEMQEDLSNAPAWPPGKQLTKAETNQLLQEADAAGGVMWTETEGEESTWLLC